MNNYGLRISSRVSDFRFPRNQNDSLNAEAVEQAQREKNQLKIVFRVKESRKETESEKHQDDIIEVRKILDIFKLGRSTSYRKLVFN